MRNAANIYKIQPKHASCHLGRMKRRERIKAERSIIKGIASKTSMKL
jgi:hypothetical protein